MEHILKLPFSLNLMRATLQSRIIRIKNPITNVNTCKILRPSINPAAPPTSARNSIYVKGKLWLGQKRTNWVKPRFGFEYEAISLILELGSSARRITIDVISISLVKLSTLRISSTRFWLVFTYWIDYLVGYLILILVRNVSQHTNDNLSSISVFILYEGDCDNSRKVLPKIMF